jgi:RNA polymerase sigma factor (sigma-70 family)
MSESLAPVRSDAEALALFKLNRRLAFWGARRFLRNLDPDDAESLALEALWYAVRHYDPTRGSLATIFSIHLIHARSAMKKNRAHDALAHASSLNAPAHHDRQGGSELLDFVPDEGEDPTKLVEARIEAEERIALLRPDERRYLLLEAQGFTPGEIAERLGLSEKAGEMLRKGAVRKARRERKPKRRRES